MIPSKNNNITLKFRYSHGLGDIIAAFLHSRPINWLTTLITGQKTPCAKCSKRANALNVLFPIQLWKWFYSSEEELFSAIRKDFEKHGFSVKENTKTNISATKIEVETIPNLQPPIHSQSITQGTVFVPNNQDGSYKLLNSGQNFLGDFRIDTQIYKK